LAASSPGGRFRDFFAFFVRVFRVGIVLGCYVLGVLPATLGLTEDETREAMEQMRAALDVLAFLAQVAANGDALIPVPGHEVVIGDSPCWFVRADVLYDKRGSLSNPDPVGNLYLTTAEALFHAADGVVARVAWSKVVGVTHDHRTLSIQRRDRQTPHVFMFNTLADTCIAGYVAHRLWSSGRVVARKAQSRSARETLYH
jgi:hypothetical protein